MHDFWHSFWMKLYTIFQMLPVSISNTTSFKNFKYNVLNLVLLFHLFESKEIDWRAGLALAPLQSVIDSGATEGTTLLPESRTRLMNSWQTHISKISFCSEEFWQYMWENPNLCIQAWRHWLQKRWLQSSLQGERKESCNLFNGSFSGFGLPGRQDRCRPWQPPPSRQQCPTPRHSPAQVHWITPQRVPFTHPL